MIFALILLNLLLIYFGFKYSKQSLIAGLCILPFHAFIVTLLTKLMVLSSPQVLVLSFWKEAILIGITIALIANIKNLKNIKFNILDFLVLFFVILSVIVSLINKVDLKSFAWGFRYDFEIFWIYYVIRNLHFNKDDIKKLFSWLIPVTLLISVFALLQFFVLPKDFLTIFGYGTGSWIPNTAIPAYQSIGDSGILRTQSSLAGPNQLGTFLVISIIVLINSFKSLSSTKFKKLVLTITIILSTIALFLTFSRSAILVFIFGIVLLINFKYIKKDWIKLLITTILIFICLIPNLFLKNVSMENKFINNYVLHQGSTTERTQRYEQNYKILKSNPIGLGLGSSGLAALRTKNDATLIPENWFIQIGIETGWLGLALFALIILYILKDLFVKSKSDHLAITGFVVLLCLTIHSFFLHTWSDSTAVFWGWAIIGFAMTQNSKLPITNP